MAFRGSQSVLAPPLALMLLTAAAMVLLPSTTANGVTVRAEAAQKDQKICSKKLPGCRKCQLVRRPKSGLSRGLLHSEQPAGADNHAQMVANDVTKPRSNVASQASRKVYVCTVCEPGWVLTGPGNVSDERPRYCVRDPGPDNSTVVRTCTGNCGRLGLIDMATNRRCFCDYWCNLYDDCCGGMDEAAAAAKDAACPAMAPVADLGVIGTCSNSAGVLASAQQCGSYRPGGCWCDQYCTAAGDCCDNCPAECGTGTCPAPKRTARGAPAPAHPWMRGACGTRPRSKRPKILGDVTTAAFSQDLEAKLQACQNDWTEANRGIAPVKTIPVVLTSTTRRRFGSANYTTEKAELLVKLMNDAYARAGFRFTLAHLTTFNFTNLDDVWGETCYKNDTFVEASCRRCKAYRAAPKHLQQRGILHVYMVAEEGPQAAFVGGSSFPQEYYGSNPGNATATPNSCLDGVWSFGFREDARGWEAAVRRDVAVVIHEVGHWLGLEHPWYQNDVDPPSDEAQCAQQTGSNYANWPLLEAALTDGVRDTPPQLIGTTYRDDGSMFHYTMYFNCSADGRFDPDNPMLKGQALACGGLGKTQGRYFNNFYNVMAYGELTCDDWNLPRRRTFTAGQIARMNCMWRCYRMNECDLGTFPYKP